MNAFDRPWCIAGGWAIDLWLGRATRGHGNIDIAVLRDDQLALRDFLDDARFFIPSPGGRSRWRDRQLLMLPIHDLHAELSGGRAIEIRLNEHDGNSEWVCRENGRIRMPMSEWSLRAGFGVPVLAPEIALLCKSTMPTAKDDLDFHSAVGSLSAPSRRWLADALKLTAPEHLWLEVLEQPAEQNAAI